ncbi:MAG: 23S rRNA (uracil(1939)-C(5))-methyltransferase RlmD [Christensenellales bacterium]|jgi:23S rRNA (uracil1939-C5)-methyltransferase
MACPVQKNDEITVRIRDVGNEGQGIGRYENYTLFVDGALPEEWVRVRVLKTKKQYGFAKLMEIVKPSAFRVHPPCPYYGQCGGCSLQHMAYEEQLRIKRQQAQSCIQRIGRIFDTHVLPVMGMQGDPYRYRNKGAFPAANGPNGLQLGLYAPHSHRLIPIEDCIIQQQPVAAVLKGVREWADEHHVLAYDETTHTGTLRHVMVRCAQDGGVQCVLVANADTLPAQNSLTERLSAIEGLRSLVLNTNREKTNVILGKKNRVLSQEKYLTDRIGDLQFRLSPHAFFQVNPQQTVCLYQKVLEFLALSKTERVLDLYCGVGTITSLLSQHCAEAIGVEEVQEAIEDAQFNASLNGISNVSFIAADAKDALRVLQKTHTFDAIVLDPPRKGCEAEVLSAVVGLSPKRIVYVSCNLATFARDAARLLAEGYALRQMQPVDMFPQTMNIECCALFILKNG